MITINEKCVKPFKLPSYHHFIMFTNEMEAVKPSKDDRRNCLIRCSDDSIKVEKKTNNTYWIKFAKCMNSCTQTERQNKLKLAYKANDAIALYFANWYQS